MKVTIRAFEPKDAIKVAKVHITTWKNSCEGIVAEDFLARTSEIKSAADFLRLFESKNEFCFVAEESKAGIVGFASAGPERSGNQQYKNELYAIYVLPDYQKKGIGRRLFHAIAEQFRRENAAGMTLWTLADNPYRQFYKNMGGLEGQESLIKIGDREYPRIAYNWIFSTPSDKGAAPEG